MADDTKNNIFSLVKGAKESTVNSKLIELEIIYKDSHKDIEQCNWFGESVEIPGLFIFGMDGAEVPTALINMEDISRINIKKI